jgi:hypothetical protein
MLWQGAPDWRVLARTAFHSHWIAGYFAALTLYALARGSLLGLGLTVGAAVVCVGLVYLVAWGSARTTIYTLTDRRVVMRIGIALSMSFNLPLKAIAAADIRPLANGHGDIALSLSGARIGWAILWPHARPWRLKAPEPMLRAVPNAPRVARMLVDARAAISPVARQDAPAPAAAPVPALVLGAAA